MLLQRLRPYFTAFVKWLLLSALVGLVVGAVGSLFGRTLSLVTELRTATPWLVWLLPVAGLIIVFCYEHAKLPGCGSTNAVFVAVREKRTLPFLTAPLIFLATALTHLFGGSAGREGAALQLGGSLSGSMGKLFRLDDHECRIMTMCGMSAAFSALFGTPLAATVFAMEAVEVGMMYHAALVPCLIASLLGVWIAGLFGLSPTAFPLHETVAVTPTSMGQVALLGVLLALLSILFCVLMHNTPKLYAKYLKNPYLRVLVGGLLVAVLTFLCGTNDYNGAGEHVIHAAMEGSALPWAFLLKMLFTALTLGSGYKGGEIVPIFFTGATFGCVVAPLLGLPAPLGAALGMVALFCGATNSPLASILLAVELFGGVSIPLFALACAVTYMLSGYFSLYSEQKIVYSKLRAEFVNRKTH